MALVPCPDCKSEISSDAPTCPRCGWKRRLAPKSTWILLAMLVFVVLGAGGAAKFCGEQLERDSWRGGGR
jgi:hypothetical protein